MSSVLRGFGVVVCWLLLAPGFAAAQSVVVRGAPEVKFPSEMTDSNSPAFWLGDTLYVFTSAGYPHLHQGPDLFHLSGNRPVVIPESLLIRGWVWIETVIQDEKGKLYGYYHHEPKNMCHGRSYGAGFPAPTAPRIGALRSEDHGKTWTDLGIVLDADPVTFDPDCKNGFFIGGHGDFSAILDREKKYLYFLFDNYGGMASEQGVVIARMAWSDRDQPVGKVVKNHMPHRKDGGWYSPGIYGRTTPIFQAKVPWNDYRTDAFWGPSVHWNTHLQCYVMLLARTLPEPMWKAEGIYISFGKDLANPKSWSEPKKIARPEWYPQVIGTDVAARETDKLCGRHARLFLHGTSREEIFFLREGEDAGSLPPPQPLPGKPASAPPPAKP